MKSKLNESAQHSMRLNNVRENKITNLNNSANAHIVLFLHTRQITLCVYVCMRGYFYRTPDIGGYLLQIFNDLFCLLLLPLLLLFCLFAIFSSFVAVVMMWFVIVAVSEIKWNNPFNCAVFIYDLCVCVCVFAEWK